MNMLPLTEVKNSVVQGIPNGFFLQVQSQTAKVAICLTINL